MEYGLMAYSIGLWSLVYMQSRIMEYGLVVHSRRMEYGL